jgi:hypothetical protein
MMPTFPRPPLALVAERTLSPARLISGELGGPSRIELATLVERQRQGAARCVDVE